MANINIKISQSVADQINRINLQNGAATKGTLAQILDSYATTANSVNTSYATYSSWNLAGSTLTLIYSDGATKTYTGVTGFNQNAASGVATATGYQFFKDGLVSISETGSIKLNYTTSISNGVTNLGLISAGGTNGSSNLSYLLPTTSTSYNADYGNIGVIVNGATTTDAGGNLGGSITKITETADKFISSLVIEGVFQVSGNANTIGQGLSSTNVSGNLSSYKVDYRDGSFQYITGGTTPISNSQVIDEKLFADASRFATADVINVNLPSVTYSDFLISSGAGNDLITIQGGGGRLDVNAGSGNDKITTLSGSHKIDGDTGFDTLVYEASLKSVVITQTTGGFQIKAVSGTDTNIVSNIERVQFTDNNLAFDLNGAAGQAFRIYQAAFNRKPDLGGLGFWIDSLDKGNSLASVSAGFVGSAEFKALYGANPSNQTLVTNFYANVLNRAPDQGGFDYWVGLLNNGTINAADTLRSFSESPENQLQVLAAIQNGIQYTVWLG
jgi:hypothetical protein